ncbi:MAG: gamma-glutamyltransferase family protein, partial [Gammaproteobacteria bacterium]|nr:gamma-glutamyltransferase family protein [Gammaproteobacteria bacterium]
MNRFLTRAAIMALGVATFMLSQFAAAQAMQPEDTHARAVAREAVTASRFMVATANPHATQVGYEVLAGGGSAIDAAVAVQMMLNLVEPQSSGIGGGAFLVYWDAGAGKLVTFDGRETAPAAATPDYFLAENGEPKEYWDAVVGGRSVGVPGTLRLLEVAHKTHGRQSWSGLLQPAIELARAGFEISPRLAASIEGAAGEKRQLDKYDAARAYFFEPDGSPKKAGTRLTNPEFADTLSAIAVRGADAFYTGALAGEIVRAVRATPENPGILTEQDIRGYRVKMREPLCSSYRGYQVCGMGPPTSGGLSVGQILGLLEHFDLPGMGLGVDAAHLFAEAARLAYADRGMYIADSDFVSVPATGLLDPAYLTARAQLIDRDSAMEKAKAGNPPWHRTALRSHHVGPEQSGTSHFSIVDANGNAVSMTTTIETGFGSRLM